MGKWGGRRTNQILKQSLPQLDPCDRVDPLPYTDLLDKENCNFMYKQFFGCPFNKQ